MLVAFFKNYVDTIDVILEKLTKDESGEPTTKEMTDLIEKTLTM